MQRKSAAERREEARLEREEKNARFRAYGYRWKKTEELTQEQKKIAYDMFMEMEVHGFGADHDPVWTLLSPLEMPVYESDVEHWLGNRGSSPDDVLAFLIEHGFTSEGKDARGIWRILPPSGRETLSLRQALQELERMRLEKVRAREEAHGREMQEAFERSVKSLQEALERNGKATNDNHAWGYSPNPEADRLPDGKIRVFTNHFEGEYHEKTFETPEEVVMHLFEDDWGNLGWFPGEWH